MKRTAMYFFAILATVIVFSGTALAKTMQEPIITIDGIITALTPLIVFGVTWLVQKVKPLLMGWNIVWVVVPILSLIASSILVLVDQATSFWSSFIWNFLSIAVAQMYIQLTSEKRAKNAEAKIEMKKTIAEEKQLNDKKY